MSSDTYFRCDKCGHDTVRDHAIGCPRCGAPVCCDLCCLRLALSESEADRNNAQDKLAAAATKIERLGRCNEQLSRSHAEQINYQNQRLAATQALLQEAVGWCERTDTYECRSWCKRAKEECIMNPVGTPIDHRLMFIAYVGDRTWKHCQTEEEALAWIKEVGGHGRIYKLLYDKTFTNSKNHYD